ncbi:MAG: hypothetical protein AAFU71_08335 [Cyanobacteria bacterium J06632_22]
MLSKTVWACVGIREVRSQISANGMQHLDLGSGAGCFSAAQGLKNGGKGLDFLYP